MRLFFTSFVFLLNCLSFPCRASAGPGAFTTHFEEGHADFAKHLVHTQNATLDFFWTTGVTLDKACAYRAPARLDVGGTPEYGQKFFPYVSSLLTHTPSHLRVRFVCDTRTRSANTHALEDIQSAFGARFEIVPVEGVITNIKAAFPDKEDVLTAAFNNATRGNPAIASDIYRLVGMYFGYATEGTLLPVQRTYCDVDTFIHGMESPTYSSLIASLFGQSSLEEDYCNEDLLGLRLTNKDGFMMWRNNTGNDVMKMHLADVEMHRRWSQDIVLSRIDPTKKWLVGRTQLHDAIRAFETCQDADKENHFFEAFSLDSATPEDVIHGTGPGFTGAGPHMVMNLDYPNTCTWAWSGIQGLKSGTSPLSFLSDSSLAHNDEGFDFKSSCDIYTNVIGACLQARRFGQDHPFAQYAMDYLVKNNPYVVARDSLRAVIWQDYETSNKRQSPSTWQESRFLSITTAPEGFVKIYPHYLHLKATLTKLGLPFEELTAADLATLSPEEKETLRKRLDGEDM